jgi:hypothetical protein
MEGCAAVPVFPPAARVAVPTHLPPYVGPARTGEVQPAGHTVFAADSVAAQEPPLAAAGQEELAAGAPPEGPTHLAAGLPSPARGHSPDYAWLVGALLYEAAHDTWYVRYTSGPEEESLPLVNPGPMKGFRSGQMVRVEGELIDPQPGQITSGYRVRSIGALPEQ